MDAASTPFEPEDEPEDIPPVIAEETVPLSSATTATTSQPNLDLFGEPIRDDRRARRDRKHAVEYAGRKRL